MVWLQILHASETVSCVKAFLFHTLVFVQMFLLDEEVTGQAGFSVSLMGCESESDSFLCRWPQWRVMSNSCLLKSKKEHSRHPRWAGTSTDPGCIKTFYVFVCWVWTSSLTDTVLLSLQGLSFLDLRYHQLLFYLQDLVHLISIKTQGQSIEDSEALFRIVTVRTVRRRVQSADSHLSSWFRI